MKKHFFFDLDDTLTLTRTPMEDDIFELYRSLPYDLIAVSGATIPQIKIQVRDLPFYTLGQNGNHAADPNGKELWKHVLTEAQIAEVREHVQKLRVLYTQPVVDENDLVEERGSQVSYSLIGHHEELAKKQACDPNKQIRLALLQKIPFVSETLEVKIGGTTCFDYIEKGKHKGYNIQKLISLTGWNPDECIYFGDALFKGGNDESVIGVIETRSVQNHRETYEILRTEFS